MMNKNNLNELFENMSPNEVQKSRMLHRIISHKQLNQRSKAAVKRRYSWLAIPALCLAIALLLFVDSPFDRKTSAYGIIVRAGEDGTIFKLVDAGNNSANHSKAVSYVDSRPTLEFYIEGENIAKIEMSTENEYIYAVDWTKTQHEKYWNTEYYQYFDEEKQISIADFNLLYDKTLTMNFDEDFDEYENIWYRWTAWDLYNWATENNYSRFLGVKEVTEDMSEQEKLEMAAGNNGAGNGHMQLEGYPAHLLEDSITVTITDREGKQTKQVIHVKVSNNELKQTVVTAWLAD